MSHSIDASSVVGRLSRGLWFGSVGFVFAAFFTTPCSVFAASPAAPSSFVMDEARMFSSEATSDVEDRLVALFRSTGRVVVVHTVDDVRVNSTLHADARRDYERYPVGAIEIYVVQSSRSEEVVADHLQGQRNGRGAISAVFDRDMSAGTYDRALRDAVDVAVRVSGSEAPSASNGLPAQIGSSPASVMSPPGSSGGLNVLVFSLLGLVVAIAAIGLYALARKRAAGGDAGKWGATSKISQVPQSTLSGVSPSAFAFDSTSAPDVRVAARSTEKKSSTAQPDQFDVLDPTKDSKSLVGDVSRLTAPATESVVAKPVKGGFWNRSRAKTVVEPTVVAEESHGVPPVAAALGVGAMIVGGAAVVLAVQNPIHNDEMVDAHEDVLSSDHDVVVGDEEMVHDVASSVKVADTDESGSHYVDFEDLPDPSTTSDDAVGLVDGSLFDHDFSAVETTHNLVAHDAPLSVEPAHGDSNISDFSDVEDPVELPSHGVPSEYPEDLLAVPVVEDSLLSSPSPDSHDVLGEMPSADGAIDSYPHSRLGDDEANLGDVPHDHAIIGDSNSVGLSLSENQDFVGPVDEFHLSPNVESSPVPVDAAIVSSSDAAAILDLPTHEPEILNHGESVDTVEPHIEHESGHEMVGASLDARPVGMELPEVEHSVVPHDSVEYGATEPSVAESVAGTQVDSQTLSEDDIDIDDGRSPRSEDLHMFSGFDHSEFDSPSMEFDDGRPAMVAPYHSVEDDDLLKGVDLGGLNWDESHDKVQFERDLARKRDELSSLPPPSIIVFEDNVDGAARLDHPVQSLDGVTNHES